MPSSTHSVTGVRVKVSSRKLWIQRINAAARENNMSYSKLIAGLHAAGVEVDRKVLAELAVNEPQAFTALVSVAADALGASN